jgi:hypothetical protein
MARRRTARPVRVLHFAIRFMMWFLRSLVRVLDSTDSFMSVSCEAIAGIVPTAEISISVYFSSSCDLEEERREEPSSRPFCRTDTGGSTDLAVYSVRGDGLTELQPREIGGSCSKRLLKAEMAANPTRRSGPLQGLVKIVTSCYDASKIARKSCREY